MPFILHELSYKLIDGSGIILSPALGGIPKYYLEVSSYWGLYHCSLSKGRISFCK